jgi:nucleoside 2-deoxyribosyltransferase
LKVFLSYSTDPHEQVIVWRLQTLATAHGVELYVPPRPQSSGFRPTGSRFGQASAKHETLLPSEVRAALDQADCVLAIITSRTTSHVEKELSYALGKGKVIVPLVEAGLSNGQFTKFAPVFRFSNRDIGKVESEVLEYLRQRKMAKEQQQALGALVAIGLGLLLLSAVSQK